MSSVVNIFACPFLAVLTISNNKWRISTKGNGIVYKSKYMCTSSYDVMRKAKGERKDSRQCIECSGVGFVGISRFRYIHVMYEDEAIQYESVHVRTLNQVQTERR